jgi:hypothetical protein
MKTKSAVLWYEAVLTDGRTKSVISEERGEEMIEVFDFPANYPTAEATYEAGATINMKNFQSARVAAGGTLPCFAEEFEKTQDLLKNLVSARMKKAVDKMRDARDGKTGNGSDTGI